MNPIRKGIEHTPEQIRAITNYYRRFLKRMNYSITPTGCFETDILKPNRDGYIRTTVMTGPKKQISVLFHRIAWIATHGEALPFGITLDHECLNKRCFNPEHLTPCSVGENNRRSNAYIRELMSRTHCPKGHLLQGENLVLNRLPRRQCRTCKRVSGALYNATVRGETFTDKQISNLERAYYDHFTNGVPAPLFPSVPEAWNDPVYAPRYSNISHLPVIDHGAQTKAA